MDKTKQQESVEEILRDICPIVKKGGDVECMGCIRGRTPCEAKCRWKNIFEAKQQLDSFYLKKHLGGLEERIKEEKIKCLKKNEYFTVGKVLSIIQEVKK